MRLPGRPNLDPELDARLVARCLEGDARAWDALVRRHERLVFAVARSYRLSDDDLGDVFQDVFAALHRGLGRMRDGRALVRWLSSTTDRIARVAALRQRREDALADREPESIARLADAGPAPGADLEALEVRHRVRLAMGALSPRCQNLLQALYYEDPTPGYSELSRRLGVPIGSLGPTRARCMDRLRQGLADLGPQPGGIREADPPTSPGEKNPSRGRALPGGGTPRRTGVVEPDRRPA